MDRRPRYDVVQYQRLGINSRDPCGYPRALCHFLGLGVDWLFPGGGGGGCKCLSSSTRLVCRGASPSSFPFTRSKTRHCPPKSTPPHPVFEGSDIGHCCGLGPIPQNSTMEPSTGREDVVHPEVRAHINSLVSAASDDTPNYP